MDKIVENWLNHNTDWFEAYASAHLSIEMVEKWIFNNRNQVSKYYENKTIADIKNNVENDENLLKNKKNKLINSKRQTNGKLADQDVELNTQSAEENLNELNREEATLKMINQLNKSPSFNCAIQTKRVSFSDDNNKQTSTTDLTDNVNQDLASIRKNVQKSKLKIKPSLESIEDEKLLVLTESPVGNAKNESSVVKRVANSFDFPNSPTSKKNNLISMRKYHTLYASDSERNSLNSLKCLIESKIKLPFSLSQQTAAHNVEKMKMMSAEKKNELEFLIELIKDVSCELCLKSLSVKIVTDLKLLVSAEKCWLFFVCKNRKCLSGFKTESYAAEFVDTVLLGADAKFAFEIPFAENVLGKVATNGTLVHLTNLNENENELLGFKKNVHFKSLLCMPIRNFNNEIIAVILLANKQHNLIYESETAEFNENDIKTLNTFLPFCGISIVHAQLFDLYAYEYDRNRALLEVVHDLFEQQTNLDIIVFRIMQKAQTLLKCQRCSVLLLVDKDDHTGTSSRKGFDLFQSGNKPGQRRHSVEDDDGTKISRSLADFVLTTGNKVNLADAYSDQRFDPLVDTVWNCKTKSILCMPIRNRDNSIIGCAQIANRQDNQAFDDNDELLFEAFCIFCGLGINNTLMYNQLEKSMAEKSVALEVLSYHATCAKNELDSFLNKYFNEETFNNLDRLDENENLYSYVFNDFSYNTDEMVLASYEMIKQLGLMKTFQIEQQTLLQWLLTVRKNYRNVEYHNWRHAFNVCQSMFAIFQNSKITLYLQDVEKLALLVGCLCHDLDHRGTNNMFQVESHSAISQLYGTTGTLEKHHFNHCIMILNTPGHNIFSHLKPRTYALVVSLIKEAILATDLVDHFSIRKKFENAIASEEADWCEEPWSSLLRKNLMTCCDLNAASKPWTIHRNVVNLVTKEFFAQGDRERLELNIEPQEMMDARRSHELPRLQVGWIDNVCTPLYKNISSLCATFNGHLTRLEDNRRNWTFLNKSTKNSN